MLIVLVVWALNSIMFKAVDNGYGQTNSCLRLQNLQNLQSYCTTAKMGTFCRPYIRIHVALPCPQRLQSLWAPSLKSRVIGLKT
jgi:hypothetical protein